MNRTRQGSKAKMRLTETLEKLRRVQFERQRLYRALSAIVRAKGEQTITWTEACAVEEDDQIDIQFDKKSGIYTIKLVGKVEETNDKLGSGSEESGVLIGSGDVEGSVPEELPVSTSDEIQEGDQHD